MTSGTLSVFAYLRFVHAKGRNAVVGEPREEDWDRKAGETGRRAGREPPKFEELHRRRQANLFSEPLRRQLQSQKHVIWHLEGDLSHGSPVDTDLRAMQQ